MSSRLTSARRSVWQAIDNWEGLANTFRKKFRFESTTVEGTHAEAAHRPEAPTSQADLPAIAIMPGAATPQWATNMQMDHPYTLLVRYWTAGRNVDRSEEIWDEIIQAVHRAKPEGNLDIDTYVKEGTGYAIPAGYGPSRMSFVKLGETQKFDATLHEFTIVLRMKINPRTGTL